RVGVGGAVRRSERPLRIPPAIAAAQTPVEALPKRRLARLDIRVLEGCRRWGLTWPAQICSQRGHGEKAGARGTQNRSKARTGAPGGGRRPAGSRPAGSKHLARCSQRETAAA